MDPKIKKSKIFPPKKWISTALIVALLSSMGSSSTFAKGPGDGWKQMKDQVASDLVQGGITFAAGLTGNVPLALIAGIAGKYISSFGIQGVKNLIQAIKGHPPQDLGEVNLAYLYLIHVKRNLYSTLIAIRKSADADPRDPNLGQELSELEKEITSLCEKGNCEPVTIDERLVNYSFLQVAMDAKQSIQVNEWLTLNEMKNTYQYLLLLYLDLIMTEQQLIQSEMFVIGEQIRDAIEALAKNEYISDAEKEYQGQLVLNIGLRWQKMLDQRRVLVAKILKQPLLDLEAENKELEDEIQQEREKRAERTSIPSEEQ